MEGQSLSANMGLPFDFAWMIGVQQVIQVIQTNVTK